MQTLIAANQSASSVFSARGAKVLFGVALLLACCALRAESALAQSFAPKVDYQAGSHPGSVAVGDFNNDGKPDLAVANHNGDTVSVFRNNGRGGFPTKVDYPTGIKPQSIAVGDFNIDGKSDLVTANFGGNTVSVLFNNSQ